MPMVDGCGMGILDDVEVGHWLAAPWFAGKKLYSLTCWLREQPVHPISRRTHLLNSFLEYDRFSGGDVRKTDHEC